MDIYRCGVCLTLKSVILTKGHLFYQKDTSINNMYCYSRYIVLYCAVIILKVYIQSDLSVMYLYAKCNLLVQNDIFFK